MSRALRGLAVGVALAAATLSTTWALLFYRPLPTIDGYFRLLGLRERAEVVRDVFGVPRIYARNAHDLFFLQGYVTAQDRYAQMEALRAALPRDRGLLAPASERVRQALGAYAAGVNKFVAQHAEARALPGGVVLSGRRPLPWTEEDSLAVAARHMGAASRCAVADRSVAAKGHGLLGADLAFDGPPPGYYEVGLDTPDSRAVGVSVPGVPGLLAGHNGWVSWAVLGGVGSNASAAIDALLEWMAARRVDDAFVRPLQGRVFEACAVDVQGVGANGAFPGLPARQVRLEDVRSAFGATRAAVGARILVDLADVDTSRSAVSHGASAHRSSPHYDDQAPLWKAGQTHRLPFSRRAVGRTDGELVFRAR